jgi:hypothetical protein
LICVTTPLAKMTSKRFFITAALALAFWPFFSRGATDAPPAGRKVYEADGDWRPINYQPAQIAKGSVLDFSTDLDAPAGKHGDVLIRGDHFYFKDAPEKPVRLYGVVVSHTLPFQDKAGCERVADYLAATGYSFVRLHSYNFGKGVMKETGSTEFTPEALDQLDYFLSCLKQRGIYFSFPLNAWAFFKAGDVKDIPEFRDRAFRFESGGLLPISADLQKWFRDYAQHLLCHVNPYTKLALKDDPALISLELDNESALFAVMQQMPVFVDIYRRLCGEHLQTTLGHAATAEEVEKALPDYVIDLQETFFITMKNYLRGLGVKQPLTDLNFRDNMVYAIPRSLLDYVDVHDYWSLYHSLPVKPVAGEIPYQQSFANPNSNAWSTYIAPIATRLFGKPYASSEFNGCYPSPYWVFTGPLEGALAGMQGWSMVARCGIAAHPSDFFSVIPPNRINTSASPIMMLSERIGAMLLAQGHVRPLPRRLPLAVTPEYLRGHTDFKGGPRYPKSYTDLAFQFQLGTVLLDGTEHLDDFRCFVVPADMELPASIKNRKCLRADQTLAGQIHEAFPPEMPPAFQLDATKGTAQIITPQTETFLLPASVSEAKGSRVSLSGNQGVAVCFAGSRDGRSLDDSRHILVLHLTDLKATGLTLDPDPKKKESFIVQDRGRLPLLVRQGTMEFTILSKNGSLPKIWALRYDGTRAVEIMPHAVAGGFALATQAVTSAEVFGAYEVLWE